MKVKIDKNDIDFSIIPLEEDIPVEGNVCVIDEATDAEIEAEIKSRLYLGDIWAWCVVRVVGKYNDGTRCFTADEYLGGCSYRDEEDFRSGVYFDDMCDIIKEQIEDQINDILSRRAAFSACMALVEAYDRGEENSGSVDWSDVDAAYELAREALE